MKKLNWIDYLIIAIVLVVVAIGCVAIKNLSDIKSIFGNKVNSNITYSFYVEKVDKDIVDQLMEAHEIYDYEKDCLLGEVVNVTYEPYKETLFDKETGKYVTVQKPEAYSAEITVNADGIYNKNNGFSVNEVKLFVTKEMKIKAPNFVVDSRVWKVEEVNGVEK